MKSEIRAFLEFYVAQNSNSIPTFRNNLSVPSSSAKQSEKNNES